MFNLIKFILLLVLFSNSAYALKVGVTAGPHAIIMEEIKKEAKKSNFDIEIIEFNDFILPNAALASGDIDVNSYQHLPFLNQQIKDRGYKIVSLAQTILLPMGIYSSKHKDLAEIKDGATISIPNDPTNGGRALLLLQKADLIKLKLNDNPTVLDIISNPKKLKIIEIEAPQILRSLPDVDLAVVNTDWIVLANIDPDSALMKEDKNSPYTNIIVARSQDEHRKDIEQLVLLYHSDHIKNFIANQFKGAVIAAW